MSISREDIAKVRACADLLPDPGPEVVKDLCTLIDEMQDRLTFATGVISGYNDLISSTQARQFLAGEGSEVATDGAALIMEERYRQIHVEGWDESHDDKHVNAELAVAAACYAANNTHRMCVDLNGFDAWPWDEGWDKRNKHNRIRQLVIAGALIAAEIDRLKRMDSAEMQSNG